MTATTDIGVRPYWELTFDAEGDVDRRQRDRLVAEAARLRITDLVIVAHGWNNDRSMANRLYGRFLAPFPGTVGPDVRLGYAGIHWPAMRFTDEPIPDFPHTAMGPAGSQALLDAPTRQSLATVFRGRELTIERLGQLLQEQPEGRSRFDEFARLVRDLVSVRESSPAAQLADDTGPGAPAMLTDDPAEVCEVFAAALESCSPQQQLLGGVPGRLWNGAKELLRQASYYAMKRRAGVVGERGLGPVIGQLAREVPDARLHLVGHSFGARLMSYALHGMPQGVRGVKSLTLLQAAFSHYAFAERLPFADTRRSGALHGVPRLVDGPVVCCFSRHDTALRVMYPLASKLAGDATSFLGLFDRWGAIGYDGIQAVDGAHRMGLDGDLGAAVKPGRCVSIDASSVVRNGPPPAGAHSDICHDQLARVVLTAGRVAGA